MSEDRKQSPLAWALIWAGWFFSTAAVAVFPLPLLAYPLLGWEAPSLGPLVIPFYALPSAALGFLLGWLLPHVLRNRDQLIRVGIVLGLVVGASCGLLPGLLQA